MPKLSLEGIVKFEPYQGSMNTYEWKDGTEVSVKLVLVSVAGADKFGSLGESIHRFNLQPIIKAKTPY